ncbi:hypothetical protein JTB14_031432 [Gonioctena quinquepunctata]|nr:hypothetical protein JTB14_031432 [Gonioctena quinquepunctata]
MKTIIAFIGFVATVSSGPVGPSAEVASQENQEYFLYEDENGKIQRENLINTTIELTASPTDITYHFFSRKNPTKSVVIHSDDISALRKTYCDFRKDTIFITHGWKNSHASDVNSYIRENILKISNVNVFVIDWSPIAGRSYITAQGNVKKVGVYAGDFIKSLKATYRLNLGKVKLVGHSLGAHISGCIGAAFDGQIDSIVGLDPAGPLFTIGNINNRLDPTDARFVQAIHTNDGWLGFNDVMGHADYYPNGGRSQPGCIFDIAGSCAHSRAYAYYAESLIGNRFASRQCRSMSDYNKDICDDNAASNMGMFKIDRSANGKYFLKTNSKSPFAEG